MKKLLGIFLLFLFAIALVFSISNEFTTKSNTVNESPGYANIIPLPPAPPPPRRGC